MKEFCNPCIDLGVCQLRSFVNGIKEREKDCYSSRIVKDNQGFQVCPKFEELLGQLGVADNPTSVMRDIESNQASIPVSSRSNKGTVLGRYYGEEDDIFAPDSVPNDPSGYFNNYVPEFLREIVFKMWLDGETYPKPKLLEQYGIRTPEDIDSIPGYVEYAKRTFPHPEGSNDC